MTCKLAAAGDFLTQKLAWVEFVALLAQKSVVDVVREKRISIGSLALTVEECGALKPLLVALWDIVC